ncbi:restriction endonuclease subunit S [Salmonella enterica subsp. enterica serovar Stockholm]|uniref:Restriction endonuclease subunit S n=1 Tax=Salmonella enterica subsp. enterica serovar Stockholm TaxID=2565057 RepID=A0A5I8V9C0_SALET|nr:restriction endonuclease subunit S [Salmonella enterica subsp. enterica serovar Stockholm]ECI7125204.1 restriction endonuclease subunit S [Salmonella enterica subsp. enterica serovar Stockholm]HBZ6150842.1 restriction endonuclease subunit S [Salmonella enterica]HBZ6159157.1 restriction endonuclease subunit S [Salmonella enterica]HCM2697204.1 restriction endonuclease subunit S [Salmonella enterica subsp. enterica serovar Yaba]
MESKWPEFRLDEITTLIIDCPHSTPEWTDSGVIVLRSNNIRNGALDLANPSFTTEEGYLDRIKRAIPTEDDIVLTREAPMGEVCIIPKGLKCCLGQRMVLIRADKTQVIPEYLLYAIQSSYIQNQISWNEGTGTTVSNIRIPNIKALKIPLPSLNIQRGIVSNLLSVDKKISLNIATNQTLEQMSQTLFKSWFVDFDPVIDNALDAGNPIPEALQSRAELRQKVRNSADFKPLPADIRAMFPAEFEETELGWMPKGWITTSFNDLIELIGGGTPKTSVEEFWNGDIPWFSVVDAPSESDVYVLTTEKKITIEGLNNSSAKLLRKGTTIISARGTVGKCAMVAVPMAMNQSCYGVIGKNNISDEYVYFQLKNAVQTLQQMGHGSVFNTITRDTFKNIKVPFCNEELTNSYSLLVKNYFSKILNNNYQNIALTNLRDTLLPKLISGELSLEDLPNLVNQTEPA